MKPVVPAVHGDSVADEGGAQAFRDPGSDRTRQRRVAEDQQRGRRFLGEGRQGGSQRLRRVRQLRAGDVDDLVGGPLRQLGQLVGHRLPYDDRAECLLAGVGNASELGEKLPTDPAKRAILRLAEHEDATAHVTPPHRTLASSRKRRASSRAASSGESASMTRPAPLAGGTSSPSTWVRLAALT